jgi:hypothetical protein
MDPNQMPRWDQPADAHLEQAFRDAERNTVYDSDAVPPPPASQRLRDFLRRLLGR